MYGTLLELERAGEGGDVRSGRSRWVDFLINESIKLFRYEEMCAADLLSGAVRRRLGT